MYARMTLNFGITCLHLGIQVSAPCLLYAALGTETRDLHMLVVKCSINQATRPSVARIVKAQRQVLGLKLKIRKVVKT